MDIRSAVELAHDVQLGLGSLDVPDFDRMRTMGMASTLAMHIRGLGEIPFEVMRKVSDHYFDIPSFALREVIEILEEIGFVQVSRKGKSIDSIIPDVPRFQDVHEGIGQYFTFSELNEHEQGTLTILSELQKKPENRDRLTHSTGIPIPLLNRCVEIGQTGNYMKQFRARGKDILTSPFYFADNLQSLADITAKVGADDIAKVLDIVKNNQGWPLSILEKRLQVGGVTLTTAQKELLLTMCQEGILKPPSIDFKTKRESFIFTPAPGGKRLDASNREIYERAMALVSCVRKGQLLAEEYKIHRPVALLSALRDRGYLGANSEARMQYSNLVFLKVGVLKSTGHGRFQFHLIKNEENKKALDLALGLLQSGQMADLSVNESARLALSKDEKYIQSIIAAAELKKRGKLELDGDTAGQFEQLLLAYE